MQTIQTCKFQSTIVRRGSYRNELSAPRFLLIYSTLSTEMAIVYALLDQVTLVPCIFFPPGFIIFLFLPSFERTEVLIHCHTWLYQSSLTHCHNWLYQSSLIHCHMVISIKSYIVTHGYINQVSYIVTHGYISQVSYIVTHGYTVVSLF